MLNDSEEFFELLHLIQELKNIRSTLSEYDDSLAKACVRHLDNAIKTLESFYKALKGEHEREEGITADLIRELAGGNKKSKQEEENTSYNQISQERPGYVHVKSHYRKGKLVNAYWRKKARR